MITGADNDLAMFWSCVQVFKLLGVIVAGITVWQVWDCVRCVRENRREMRKMRERREKY